MSPVRVVTNWSADEVAESLRDEMQGFLEATDGGKYEDGSPSCMEGACGNVHRNVSASETSVWPVASFVVETNGGEFRVTVERLT